MNGFSAIFGQDRPISVLRQAIRRGKVAHAYLFAGPPGVGKASTAKIFAAALNCLNAEDDACGECRSCRKMADGNHPDFSIVQREEGKKQIVIGQVRELIKKTQYSPFEGKYKVFLLDGVEDITIEAANALLKTLEEPTKQTVIVLVTPAPHQLPSTVVSRCQMLRFGPLEEKLVKDWAEKELDLNEEDATLVASLADGSLGKAGSLDVEFLHETRISLFQQLAEADTAAPAQALALSMMLREAGEDLRDGIELLTGFLRDAVVWQISESEKKIRNRDALPLIRMYAGKHDRADLLAKLRSLVYARRLVERNVNKDAIVNGLSLDLIGTQQTDYARGRLPR